MTKAAEIKKEDIAGIEARFVVHCPAVVRNGDDLHMVKEMIHLKDGTMVPNVRLIKNYQRSFYVTKKASRNHKQNKEWEKIENVTEFKCTQSALSDTIRKATEQQWRQGDPRQLLRDPYIYGADILSTAVLKQQYMDNFKGKSTRFSVACFDTEKDVIRGTDKIIMATLSMKDKVFTAIDKSFVDGQGNVHDRLQEKLNQYLGKFVEERGIKWEILLVDNDVEIIKECFQRAHAWRPDWLAIWNINFDMPLMLKTLQEAGVRPEDVFCDPGIPYQFRSFYYKQGPKQKRTDSGKVMPIKPAAQWHTVFCPASFYFIDSMCAYRHIRTGSQEEQSYALDAILDKIFKDQPEIRKLKFEEASQFTGLEWHQFMQQNYPLEYTIYCVFDCVSMELLDEKTVDLQLTLPSMSGCSDFCNFKSQPRRLVDGLHYFLKDRGYVIGTTSDEMKIEEDKYTLGLDGWIVTLPAHLVADNGLQCILENPGQRTNIRVHVADLDVSASYPNGGAALNISKATTTKEMFRIRGVDEHTQRMNSINLSGGATNSFEWCQDMLKMPSMEQLLEAFIEDKNKALVIQLPDIRI